MKKKKWIVVVAAILVVILIEIVVIGVLSGKSDLSNVSIFAGSKGNTGASASAANGESGDQETIYIQSQNGADGASGEYAPEDGKPEGTASDGSYSGSNSSSSSNSNTSSHQTNSSTNQNGASDSNTPETLTNKDADSENDDYPIIPETTTNPSVEPEETVVTFPYTIPNTGLTIENIASYDGIFLEDGSDSSVSGIYSIVVKNTGRTDVEYAKVTLNCNGTPITFELSDLPSGATVVAQESNQTAYRNGVYEECSADLAEVDDLEQSAGQVSVQENEDGSLTVSNLTGSRIPCVRVFYKFYMDDEDVYVGGITYTAKLTDLEAGSSQTIIPSHYSQGYSKVVMVRTYDSKE